MCRYSLIISQSNTIGFSPVLTNLLQQTYGLHFESLDNYCICEYEPLSIHAGVKGLVLLDVFVCISCAHACANEGRLVQVQGAPLRRRASRRAPCLPAMCVAVTSDAFTHVTPGHVIRSITRRRKSNGSCRRNHCSGAKMGVVWKDIRRRHASATASAMMMSSSPSSPLTLLSLPPWINYAFRHISQLRRPALIGL